jgi:putative ABC transport system ATP-binding protein
MLMSLDKGTFLFNGKPVNPHEQKRIMTLRQDIGIVFQDSKLLPNLNVLENVCLPLAHRSIWPSKQKVIAQEMLERVNMSHRINHFPSQLSGGEMARVAFARILTFRPRLILADEPTGNLDSETGCTVSDLLLSSVDSSHGLVLVTHQVELAERTDRKLFIKDGQLVSRL